MPFPALFLRNCAPYENPPHVISGIQPCAKIHEKFGKEALMNEEVPKLRMPNDIRLREMMFNIDALVSIGSAFASCC